MLNVRPTATLEGRARGGSRPGLAKRIYTQLGSGNPVRMLAACPVIRTDGFTVWNEDFAGTTLGDAWAAASWVAGGLPAILPDNLASVEYAGEVGAVRDALSDIKVASDYCIELYIVPYLGAHHGTYKLYCRMDNATPVGTTAGAIASLTLLGSTGLYTGNLTVYVAGVPTVYAFTGGLTGQADAGWFKVAVSGNTVTCYWLGNTILSQAIAAPAGARVGFGMNATVEGGICLARSFRAQYYTNATPATRRNLLLASANGNLYRETFLGTMEEVTSNASLASDRQVQAAARGGKLYIADTSAIKVSGTDGVIAADDETLDAVSVPDWTAHGLNVYDDVVVLSSVTGNTVAGTYKISTIAAGSIVLTPAPGDGTATFRIERGPKVYDPATNTLALWVADTGKGQIPTGCPLICTYRDRLTVAAGSDAPHAWYQSRQGDPLDWDYGAGADDGQRAVAGPVADAGQIGEQITALAPHSDDYLVIGCENSWWLLRGDAAFGGQIDALSRAVGILDKAAHCQGPNGELVALSRDGLYILAPGAQSFPVSVSREKLPAELRNVDRSHYTVGLAYDTRDRGVHVFLTPTDAKGNLHWWFDWESKSFWPVALQGTHDPTAVMRYDGQASEESVVLLGGRDGNIRAFDDHLETDDGYEIESWVEIGPVRLGGDDLSAGIVREIDGTLALESGPVDWRVLIAASASGAVEATARAQGTWISTHDGGRNFTVRPLARGGCFTLLLENNGKRRWAVEGIAALLQRAGRQRLQ